MRPSLTVMARHFQAGGGGVQAVPALEAGHAGLLVHQRVEVNETVFALHVRAGLAGADETSDAVHVPCHVTHQLLLSPSPSTFPPLQLLLDESRSFFFPIKRPLLFLFGILDISLIFKIVVELFSEKKNLNLLRLGLP